MQAKKRDEIDVCVCVVVGRQQFAMLPRHPNTYDWRHGLFFYAPPPPLRRRFIAIALQFLVWLAENCEGDFAMNQQNKKQQD
jgi:hypothetical protein